ncbi:MAG TPA: WS/DGAT domain-containing protein, partial [Acidimicrobiales bacterium]|nr:WS/DGAT domain-containing protein [Acidimicrobiales bacterium]
RAAHDATAPGLVDATASVLSSLPPPLVARVARQQTSSVDFAASTLPGLASTRWLAGARVLHSHPMGPTGGTAFLATVLSSAGTLDLGLCCDRGAVLDPAELAERIGTGFVALGCTPRPLGKTGPGKGVT